MTIYLLTIIVCLMASAILSGMETGILRLTASHGEQSFQGKDDERAAFVAQLIQDKDELTAVILIANNIALTVAAATATSLLYNEWDFGEQSTLVATLVITPIILFVGEMLPKSYFLIKPYPKVKALMFILNLLKLVLAPLSLLARKFKTYLVNLLPGEIQSDPPMTRKDIELVLQSMMTVADEDRKEREFAQQMILFPTRRVQEVMKPLIDVVLVSIDQNIEELVQLIQRSGFSRIPVYEGSVNSIIGVVHAKDILLQTPALRKENRLDKSMVRKVPFVPDSTSIKHIWNQMLTQNYHTAMVVDEYGTPVGVITMEDIMEEIFGEFYDETDSVESQLCVPLGKNVFILSGRCPLEELRKTTGISLPSGPYETVAGFLEASTGRIPSTGETVEIADIKFKIILADKRKIERIRIALPSKPKRG